MQPPARREAIRAAMADAMRDYAAEGGGYVVPAVAAVHSAARA